MKTKNIFQIFEQLEDPRIEKKTKHRLVDIIGIAVCAVLVGSETFEDIELYGHSKKEWLEQYLELKNGIPSHDTFRRVFSLISPTLFQSLFSEWIRLIFGETLSEHVAIDGKSLKGSQRRKGNKKALHIVNAFCSKTSLFLAQETVQEKSGEKSVLPNIINQLHLTGTLVSIDAGGCFPDIAQNIIDKQGHYLLGLKGNQKTSFEYVKDYFETNVFPVQSKRSPDYDAFDDSHGRSVRRRVFVCHIDIKDHQVLSKWPNISRLIAIETISTRENKKTTADFRYYISNSNKSPEFLAHSIRNHWAVENGLHWVLDVTFDEDRSRIRDAVAAQNMSALRKFTLNILRKDSKKISLKAKRKLAGWSESYLLSLLKLF
jgi:predicted transposase YbfD/YdcC